MISLRSVAGATIALGRLSVTPVARRWSLQWPGGGVAWASPLEVVVETKGSAPRVVHVGDATRRAQIALLAIGASAALLIRWRKRR